LPSAWCCFAFGLLALLQLLVLTNLALVELLLLLRFLLLRLLLGASARGAPARDAAPRAGPARPHAALRAAPVQRPAGNELSSVDVRTLHCVGRL
jgi:hypothetical protein